MVFSVGGEKDDPDLVTARSRMGAVPLSGSDVMP